MTYQYAATAANGVVQVGVIAVLARLIAPVEFGQVGLATAYVGFWALFAAFGVGSSLVQRPHLDERLLRAAFTLSLSLGLLASVLVFVTAPLAARLLGSASLTDFIRVLSATFLLSSPGIVAEGLLQREFEWQRLTRLNRDLQPGPEPLVGDPGVPRARRVGVGGQQPALHRAPNNTAAAGSRVPQAFPGERGGAG